MKRLAIVADHSFVVEAIRIALRHTTGFQILGYVDGRAPVGAALTEARPDVVIVDDMERPEDAVARISEVRTVMPDAKIILLTLRMDAEWLDEAMAVGAHSVVCKAVHPVSLGTLVREIANGNVFHRRPAREVAVKLRERETGLTNRELEILRLVAGGESNGRIARQLWVTEQTVKFHLSNIYRKLGVANRTQASHYAHVNRLLEDEPVALAS
jgi:DNA-binding NarL/FixJ family response regulator